MAVLPAMSVSPTRSDPPAPLARRLRPPGWRDRRLLVGIALVLASVAVGVAVVGRADDTHPVYAAARALVPGQRLTADDLHVVRVQLGPQSGRYLSADRSLAGGAVVIRSVLSGELVPSSAIGDQAAVTSRPVAVVVPAGSVDGLRPGSLVDVWVAAKGVEADAYLEPKTLVSAAEVVSVTSGGGVLASSTDATVRLLLADELVPQLLSAVDNGARVNLVAVPGSVPRGGS